MNGLIDIIIQIMQYIKSHSAWFLDGRTSTWFLNFRKRKLPARFKIDSSHVA